MFDSLRFRLAGGRSAHLRELRSLLRPLHYAGLRKIRVGNEHGDGGYVMDAAWTGTTAALSLGIGQDISWDLAMADVGVEIYQYDHTVAAPAPDDPRLHFFACGISAHPRPGEPFKTLAAILATDAAAHTQDLILKIDIDGFEWDVFYDASPSTLLRFRQICIEFHHPLARPAQTARRERNLAVFRKLFATHAPIHLHANNAGPVRRLLGFALPKLLEVTYVRRDDLVFTASAEAFPGPLDRPNLPQVPEIPIGQLFGY